MKLKLGGKILLFVVVAVVAFFVLKRFVPSPAAGTSDSSASTSAPASEDRRERRDNEGSGNSTSNSTSASTDKRSFDFLPEKPVGGTLRGVVEVGASGFNSFVINMDQQKRWEIVSKDFGESLAYEGLATTDDIRAGLKKYLAGMFEKGVNKNNMHFVISSGAQKESKTSTIANELKKMGYVVNLVTADQEAKYAFKATVPPAYQDNSFLVDIGSGNTKISWQNGAGLSAVETPGAKYYEQGKSDDVVYSQVKADAGRVPDGKRNVAFIIGGVPFTLAKQNRHGEERYTVLNQPNSYKGTDKKMTSGLNIYQALEDATKCDTFVFDWDANFTIGFLLSLR